MMMLMDPNRSVGPWTGKSPLRPCAAPLRLLMNSPTYQTKAVKSTSSTWRADPMYRMPHAATHEWDAGRASVLTPTRPLRPLNFERISLSPMSLGPYKRVLASKSPAYSPTTPAYAPLPPLPPLARTALGYGGAYSPTGSPTTPGPLDTSFTEGTPETPGTPGTPGTPYASAVVDLTADTPVPMDTLDPLLALPPIYAGDTTETDATDTDATDTDEAGGATSNHWRPSATVVRKRRSGKKRKRRWSTALPAEESEDEDMEEPYSGANAADGAPLVRVRRKCAEAAEMRICDKQGKCVVCLGTMRQWAGECAECSAKTCLDCVGRWKETCGGVYSCPICRAKETPDFRTSGQ